MLRLLHVVVFAALVLAAVDVYKIKYEATLQSERVAKLRAEVRREHEAIAALRAEWTQLDNPERLQLLARRHLPLNPADTTQFDSLDRLPERPPQIVPPDSDDPIRAIIETLANDDRPTGSIPAPDAGR
jgi:cell division protein FtsL